MQVSGLAFHPAYFMPGERTPGTHSMGNWVGPGASLHVWRREKFLCVVGIEP